MSPKLRLFYLFYFVMEDLIAKVRDSPPLPFSWYVLNGQNVGSQRWGSE